MARQTTGDKPGDIRRATIAEVAHVGSTAVSVNKIAKRAGLSVGTLYRLHRSKEELLFDTYLDAKRRIHHTMMTAASEFSSPSDRLKAMWFALVDYGFDAPKDFQLVEIMSAESNALIESNAQLKVFSQEVLREIQLGIDQGVLVPAEATTIETVLASPAITLVRRAGLSGRRVDQGEVERIFALIWRGLSQTKPEEAS